MATVYYGYCVDCQIIVCLFPLHILPHTVDLFRSLAVYHCILILLGHNLSQISIGIRL